jgi:hypothetical protein
MPAEAAHDDTCITHQTTIAAKKRDTETEIRRNE